MHLLVDISAHGLGHLAQAAPVLEALHVQLPTLQLTVRSALLHDQLRRRISLAFEHVPEARDFGYVMHNAVDIDLAASAQRYREFHRDWPQRIAAEAAWLIDRRVDAVLTDVAYLPLAAAAQIGVPSVGLCSLNWADLFQHYFGAETWAAPIHGEILAAYNAADRFLRVQPGMPMPDLHRAVDVGLIARQGHRDRAQLASRLGLSEADRWVLLAMGGIEFRLPVETWPQIPDTVWLVPRSWQVQRADVRAFDAANMDFADLMASVDAVVTKPGYGTFAEAACNGAPVLYVQRGNWPEEVFLVSWLAKHARARVLSRERLMGGDFLDDLNGLWRQPAPARPRAVGAMEAADLLHKLLGSGAD